MLKIHIISIFDNLEYFYNTIVSIAQDTGFIIPSNNERNHKTIEEFFQSYIIVY